MQYILQIAQRVSFRHFSQFLFLLIFSVAHFSVANAADSLEVGYRTLSFPSGVGGNSEPTAEKPESKLWFHDDLWWASMWSNTGDAYHIFYLDLSTQDWIDTGVQLDPRIDTKADALLDGDTLYVVSHIWEGSAGSASAGNRGELFRYEYDSQNKTWIPTSGFPVEVNQADGESLVIAKDTAGILWITYVKDRKVYINHTVSNDADWATPSVLPVGSAANVTDDDVSGIISFNGKIGIMWSNQSSGRITYFAVHNDGDAADSWASVEAYGSDSDDHINVKSLACDDTGGIYAAVKGGGSPTIVMVRCPGDLDPLDENNWEVHTVFGGSSGSPTRPQLLVDIYNRQVYVFVRYRENSGNGDIFYKISDLDNIDFSGDPLPFIQSSADDHINDPTTTKQCVDNRSGLVVLASDSQSRRYFHNYFQLGPDTPEQDIAVSPSPGDFGNVIVGASTIMTFTIENEGDSALAVTSSSIAGPDAAQFGIISGGGFFTINPGETSDVDVAFTPASEGNKNALLTIISDDPDENPLQVPISGIGEAPAPDIIAQPVSFDFGNIIISESDTAAIEIGNNGTQDLVVSSSSIEGTDASEFSIITGSGNFTLAPLETHLIEIRFNPSSQGNKGADLRLNSNDPNEDPFDVPLAGNGITRHAQRIANL